MKKKILLALILILLPILNNARGEEIAYSDQTLKERQKLFERYKKDWGWRRNNVKKLLFHHSYETRRNAAMELCGQSGWGPHPNPLIRLIRDRKDRKALPPLLYAMEKDPSREVRMEIVYYIGKFLYSQHLFYYPAIHPRETPLHIHPYPQNPQIIYGLKKALKKDNSEEVRYNAGQSLLFINNKDLDVLKHIKRVFSQWEMLVRRIKYDILEQMHKQMPWDSQLRKSYFIDLLKNEKSPKRRVEWTMALILYEYEHEHFFENERNKRKYVALVKDKEILPDICMNILLETIQMKPCKNLPASVIDSVILYLGNQHVLTYLIGNESANKAFRKALKVHGKRNWSYANYEKIGDTIEQMIKFIEKKKEK